MSAMGTGGSRYMGVERTDDGISVPFLALKDPNNSDFIFIPRLSNFNVNYDG